jgi:hypothetical protein
MQNIAMVFLAFTFFMRLTGYPSRPFLPPVFGRQGGAGKKWMIEGNPPY